MTYRHAAAVSLVVLGAIGSATPVHFAGAVSATDAAPPAPERLRETGLYTDSGAIDPSNRPFAPQYPLWSDGLTKKRWVSLPPGGRIDGTNEHDWKFPAGTRLWKEFSLNDRRIETRMLWKASESGWVTASYVWNSEGTEARLAPIEGVADVVEVGRGRRHSIPSRSDCAACHGTSIRPLGFTALQLSTDRDSKAIHGEPLRAGELTLRILVEEGMLSGTRRDLLTNPPRIRTAHPDTRSVVGYLAVNCGPCHNGSSEIAVSSFVVSWRDLASDGDAVARSFVNRLTRWQLPGVPDGTTVLLHPGSPETSALLRRMRSRAPSSQMPPLGTVIRDDRAVEAVTRWIQNMAVQGAGGRAAPSPTRANGHVGPG